METRGGPSVRAQRLSGSLCPLIRDTLLFLSQLNPYAGPDATRAHPWIPGEPDCKHWSDRTAFYKQGSRGEGRWLTRVHGGSKGQWTQRGRIPGLVPFALWPSTCYPQGQLPEQQEQLGLWHVTFTFRHSMGPCPAA